MSGVGSSPALATCETSQILLAGVPGGFSRDSSVFAKLLIGPSHIIKFFPPLFSENLFLIAPFLIVAFLYHLFTCICFDYAVKGCKITVILFGSMSPDL